MRKKLGAYYFPGHLFFAIENLLKHLILYAYLGSWPQAAPTLFQPPKSTWLYLEVGIVTSYLLSWDLENLAMFSKCGKYPVWSFATHPVWDGCGFIPGRASETGTLKT